MEKQPTVKIIASSTAGDLVCAAGGRISTTQGTALEIFGRTREKDNNASLIEKVVGSGHTSTLEHQFFTVAFDSVSVFTEEFVIEFRLGSYTVQSRRYVDYSQTGFYVPPLPDDLQKPFTDNMQALFDDYAALLELGIPKEDARFVLPYCFRSNFYCTMNARELIYMATVMTKGRGAAYPELKMLGESLLEQIRVHFPNVPDKIAQRFDADTARYAPVKLPPIAPPRTAGAETILQALSPTDPAAVLRSYPCNWMCCGEQQGLGAIVHSERPRELELIHARFEIRNLSLAAITHLVRHRVQTVLVPHIAQAAVQNTYLLPDSVRGNGTAKALYQLAFSRNTENLRAMLEKGLPVNAVQYFALAGNQLSVLCDMNGRELLHFIKLRTCTRAQWEIRGCAVNLLRQLRAQSPELFALYGPSCFVAGKCPEGRLTCGKINEIRETFSGEL